MKVIKPQKLGLLHRVFESDGRCYFVVTIFACIPFDAPRSLIAEIGLWKLAGDELKTENTILDEGFSKVSGEVLVTGRCYPPTGMPAQVSFVRVQMGTVDKRLAVFGDRRWKLGVPTNPEPFTEMPIDWAHAFGGQGFDKNPLGKGFAPVEGEGGKVHALPNIEFPDKLIVGPKDRPPPAGFSAYDLTWPQRFTKVGTYDQKWIETRFPGVAADMNPRFFNVAPEDQWIEGYFRNDEAFVIENMHPTRSRIEGRLPGFVGRAFIEHARPGVAEPVLREIPTRIDTVRLFPHKERAVIVYRGMIEIAEDDADDVKCLLIACDDAAAPRGIDHYRAAIETRKDHEKAGIASLRDDELLPPDCGPPLELGDDNDLRGIMPEDTPLRDNLARRQEAEREKAKAALRARGLDPKDYGLDKNPEDDDPPPPPHNIEASIQYLDRRLAKLEQDRKQLEARKKEMEAQSRAAYAERKMDYDALAAQAKKDAAGPPKFTAQGHLDRMRDLCHIAREGGGAMPELEAQLEDPAYRQELVEQETQIREMYRKSAHRQHAVEPLSREQSETVRAELEAAKVAGIAMPNRDFTGVDLSELDLSGIDLTGAFLESANLTGTNLAGARLAGAVLAHGKIVKTNLTGADLQGANLGAAQIQEADLGDANLSGAIFSLATITKTRLAGAKLVRAQLLESKFGEAVDLSGASAPKTTVLRVDMREARFAGADFSGATFAELSLEGAVFDGAILEKTTFLQCNVDRASFRNANLLGAQFVHGTTAEEADFSESSMRNANLRGVRLVKAKIGRADAAGADFSGADLSGGNLYQTKARGARFTRTDLTDAGMISIDLMEGMLQKAILRGTDLTGANLFRADMSKVRVDGRTKIGETNMKSARVLPRSKP
ncbi:DUF2169 family type VI secretion system accessory protein [Polyangium aurulentum]|uniref:DUF2169 family type VI secretion system accessory protein n=1 Tax=Polyangium aurulentum TaxID=2567896 RepID=UPI0010AEBFD9|nr:DUF2169 domain-containing protein [Polyangium aurulentum]UQA59692.1 DUF2169 domain-containing protein [Polyangium aurulentum]